MTYEHNLRRLFLPPIESLPIEEQLTRYKQRDFIPSHLYRIGTHLFGGSAFNVRRRVIDAGQFSPPSGVGHHVYLNASLDGKTYEQSDKAGDNDKIVSEPSVKLSDTESEYKKWLADRKIIRRDLDGLGANEKWLTSKERTPLEAALLTKLRNESKNKDTMKMNLDIKISEVSRTTTDKLRSCVYMYIYGLLGVQCSYNMCAHTLCVSPYRALCNSGSICLSRKSFQISGSKESSTEIQATNTEGNDCTTAVS